MRKAQVSQVFTYIIILLVIGVLVVMGYRGIMSIMKTSCQHERVLFERDLLNFIDENTDKGSVHEETLKAPCDVTEICLVNSNYCPSTERQGAPLGTGTDAVIRSAADDCTSNVFFKGKFTEAVGFSNKIALAPVPPSTLQPTLQCFNVRSGEFKFLFTGLGRKTQIESGWENP